MKQVYTSQDRLYIYHLKNLLEIQGIKCLVKNDGLSSIVGEIPVLTAWPELWVTDPDLENWAKEIIRRSKKDAVQGKTWVCEQCGEEHSAQFTDCWQCQSDMHIEKAF
jgi:hypothetical protein